MSSDIQYKRESYHNYVVIHADKENTSHELKMFLDNHISNFLSISLNLIDKECDYYYETTNHQQLKDILEVQKFNYKDCIKLFSDIFSVIDTAEEYLLDSDSILLRPECIYYDTKNKKYDFIYHFDQKECILIQFNKLTEYLMERINYEDEKGVLLLYAIYHESKKENNSLRQIKNCFQDKVDVIQNKKEEDSKEKKSVAKESIAKDSIEKDSVAKKSVAKENVAEKSMGEQLVKPPLVEEKSEEEQIILVYPKSSYLLFGCSVLILVIFLVAASLLQVEGYRILLIGICGTALSAYVARKVFKKDCKQEKTKINVEYKLVNHTEEEEEVVVRQLQQPNIEEAIKTDLLYDNEEETQLLYIDQARKIQPEVSVVSESVKKQYWLIPCDAENYTKLKLSDTVSFVGKMEMGVDCIINNKEVSRIHAKIEKKEEKLYITDLNSSNGTYINDVMLSPYTVTEINLSDLIKFASVSYRVEYV